MVLYVIAGAFGLFNDQYNGHILVLAIDMVTFIINHMGEQLLCHIRAVHIRIALKIQYLSSY